MSLKDQLHKILTEGLNAIPMSTILSQLQNELIQTAKQGSSTYTLSLREWPSTTFYQNHYGFIMDKVVTWLRNEELQFTTDYTRYQIVISFHPPATRST